MKTPEHNTAVEGFKKAHAAGLLVRLPRPNELFIDIDVASDLRTFRRTRDLIEAYVGIEKVVITNSRHEHNKEGKHIVVTLKTDVTAIERIALQAILGSDSRREAHSFIRYKNDELFPTCFWEKRRK